MHTPLSRLSTCDLDLSRQNHLIFSSVRLLAVMSPPSYLTDILCLCHFRRLSPPLEVSHSLALPHAIWTTSDVKPSGGVSIGKISHYDLSILVITPTPGPILRRRYLRPASQDLVTHTPPHIPPAMHISPGQARLLTSRSSAFTTYLPTHWPLRVLRFCLTTLTNSSDTSCMILRHTYPHTHTYAWYR